MACVAKISFNAAMLHVCTRSVTSTQSTLKQSLTVCLSVCLCYSLLFSFLLMTILSIDLSIHSSILDLSICSSIHASIDRYRYASIDRSVYAHLHSLSVSLALSLEFEGPTYIFLLASGVPNPPGRSPSAAARPTQSSKARNQSLSPNIQVPWGST